MTISKTIKDSPLFCLLDDQQAEIAGNLFTEKKISEGMAIFVENMPGESLYLIVSGTVRISKMISEGEEKTLIVLGPDDFFGEMAIIDGAARSATARVIENAHLLALKKADFELLCKNHPAIGLQLVRNILSVFAQRIRESNQDIREMILWQHKRS